jgi:hypothetical protein
MGLKAMFCTTGSSAQETVDKMREKYETYETARIAQSPSIQFTAIDFSITPYSTGSFWSRKVEWVAILHVEEVWE